MLFRGEAQQLAISSHFVRFDLPEECQQRGRLKKDLDFARGLYHGPPLYLFSDFFFLSEFFPPFCTTLNCRIAAKGVREYLW